jgi:hypothetical protein
MVFTLGLRHTFRVWQRGLALVQFFVVQTRSLRYGRCRKNLPLGDLTDWLRMTAPNPYETPKSESHPEPTAKPVRRFRARVYVIPVAIGALIGSVALAPFCRGPGDPGGHSIAAGLGGFVGLFVGIVVNTLRITFRRGP